MIDSPLPSVVFDLHSHKTSVVYSNNQHGSELAVEHLLQLGHRRIAHIHGHFNTFAGQERYKGFMAAMASNNQGIPEDYIVNGHYFSHEGGY